MDFNTLSTKISLVHTELKNRSKAAVNSLHTLRNWMIGYYIVAYEQDGLDRAKYGDRLIKKLASDFSVKGIKDLSFTSLNIFRQFYLTYPQIIQTLSEQSSLPKLQNSCVVFISSIYLLLPNETSVSLFFLSQIGGASYFIIFLLCEFEMCYL